MDLGRIMGAAFVLTAATAAPAAASEVNLTGAVQGGSRLCNSSGCSKTEDNRQLSVFVVRTAGESARVRRRGRSYNVDIDRVVVKLSDCSLKLRTYLGGAKCS